MKDETTTLTVFCFFFFNDTATTEIYTLSLHDALPIYREFEGEYILDGISIRKIPEKNLCKVRNQKIGFVFQSFHLDRKSTRLNSSHANISYAVFCLKKKSSSLLFIWCHGQQNRMHGCT